MPENKNIRTGKGGRVGIDLKTCRLFYCSIFNIRNDNFVIFAVPGYNGIDKNLIAKKLLRCVSQ